MFIISLDSDELVEAGEQDYRRTRHGAELRPVWQAIVRIVVALSGLLFVGMNLLRFTSA